MSDKARLKVAFIMGKMDSGGKKTLAMQYFLNFGPGVCEVHFICDKDSNAVPEGEIAENKGFVHYVAPYQRILENMSDMKRIFDEEQFDVVHAFNSTMNLFSLFVAKRSGIPVRISESLSMAHEREPKTYLKLFLRKFSGLFATHYMSCGEDCGRWQFGDRRFDSGDVAVFKTAIDSKKYAYDSALRKSVRNELGISEDDFVVGFIGRFAPQKNPVFLMEVMSEVLLLEPSAKMVLVGDGDLKGEMFSVLDPKECDAVKYLGRREDIVGFYQAMDCFLLPSLYEGLPVVGLEAQCAGCEVFFSDEVTREAAFCDLGHFLPLSRSPKEWASEIVESCEPKRERASRVTACIDAGYDSGAEAKRLQAYYVDALNLSRCKR